jgi:hypothetical protein
MNKFAKKIIDIDGDCLRIDDLSCDNCPVDKDCRFTQLDCGIGCFEKRIELAKEYISRKIRNIIDE